MTWECFKLSLNSPLSALESFHKQTVEIQYFFLYFVLECSTSVHRHLTSIASTKQLVNYWFFCKELLISTYSWLEGVTVFLVPAPRGRNTLQLRGYISHWLRAKIIFLHFQTSEFQISTEALNEADETEVSPNASPPSLLPPQKLSFELLSCKTYNIHIMAW